MSMKTRMIRQKRALSRKWNTQNSKKKDAFFDTDINMGESQIYFLKRMKPDTNQYVV